MSRLLRTSFFPFLICGAIGLPAVSEAQVAVGVSITVAPPALPVYAQPVCPEAGYMWTPGYWAYGPEGYYWVPGTWIMPPAVGLLWTPGYWGWGGGYYAWHAGYWGPHVGFYGGIDYGFGYGGVGYVGGGWQGNVFAYNTSVTNVNTTIIHNTYNTTVVSNTNVNHVSFNGGTGGTAAQPSAAEQAAGREQHTVMTTAQTQHAQAASQNRAFLASTNHGHPSVAASPRPGVFNGHGVTAAHANNVRSAGAPPSATNHAAVHESRPSVAGQTQRTAASPFSHSSNGPHPQHVNSPSVYRPPHPYANHPQPSPQPAAQGPVRKQRR
jgi:hypothetical protein